MKRRKKQIHTIKFRAGIFTILTIFILLFSINGLKTKATTIPGFDTDQMRYESVYIEKGATLWDIANEHTDGSKKQINYCMKEIKRINHMSRFELLKAGNYVIVPCMN